MADTAASHKKPMSQARAVKILSEAAKAQLQKLAFDANLFEQKLCSTPHAEASYKQRKLILEAIEVLKNDFQEKK